MASRHDLAESYLAGMDRETFAASDLIRDAVERCVERVCEAAHRFGHDAAVIMPSQPWGDIRAMGNRLRHAYDRVSPDVIWNTARHDLSGLAADARQALTRLERG